MAGTTNDPDWDRMRTLGVLQEYRFRSRLPIVGPLVARLRALWNNVSTTWYVRPLIEQQNAFNAGVVAQLRDEIEQLRDVQASIQRIQMRLEEGDSAAIQADHEQVELRRDLAAVSLRVTGLQRRLAETGQEPTGQGRE